MLLALNVPYLPCLISEQISETDGILFGRVAEP